MRRSIFVFVAIVIICNNSSNSEETSKESKSPCQIQVVANPTRRCRAQFDSWNTSLDLSNIGYPSQQRPILPQSYSKEDGAICHKCPLAMWNMLEAYESQARVLPYMWRTLVRGLRQVVCPRSGGVQRRAELAAMGGNAQADIKQTHLIFKEKNERQRQGEGAVKRQRLGQNGSSTHAIPFCHDVEHSRFNCCDAISAAEHLNNSPARDRGHGQQRAHACHTASIPRLTVDAERAEGCGRKDRERGHQGAHSGTPPSHDIDGKSTKESQRVARCKRASQTTVVAAHGKLPEDLAATNGELRQKTAGLCRGNPKSEKRYGSSTFPHPDSQCQSGRKTATTGDQRSHRGGRPGRSQPHLRQRGAEAEKESPTTIGGMCDQDGDNDCPGICHRIRRREERGRERWDQKTKIVTTRAYSHRTKAWNACFAWLILSQGSALSCLRKPGHVPRACKSVSFDVPAYHDLYEMYDAAHYQSLP